MDGGVPYLYIGARVRRVLDPCCLNRAFGFGVFFDEVNDSASLDGALEAHVAHGEGLYRVGG